MEIFLVYLWMQLNSFLTALGLIVAFCIVCGFINLICQADTSYGDKEHKKIRNNELRKKAFKWFTKAGFVLALITVIPSQGTIAAMVGTYYAKEAITSVEGTKVMSLIRKKANEYLDAELKAK